MNIFPFTKTSNISALTQIKQDYPSPYIKQIMKSKTAMKIATRGPTQTITFLKQKCFLTWLKNIRTYNISEVRGRKHLPLPRKICKLNSSRLKKHLSFRFYKSQSSLVMAISILIIQALGFIKAKSKNIGLNQKGPHDALVQMHVSPTNYLITL